VTIPKKESTLYYKDEIRDKLRGTAKKTQSFTFVSLWQFCLLFLLFFPVNFFWFYFRFFVIFSGIIFR